MRVSDREWTMIIGYLICLRDGLRDGKTYSALCDSLEVRNKRVRYWITRLGLREYGSRSVQWDQLNQYLKPACQIHTGPCRAHGAELLYAL
jgi:hypothetical protein